MTGRHSEPEADVVSPAVLSSDQRNAGGAIDLGWSLSVQFGSGPVVELADHGLQLVRGVDREVGLLREVLPQQAVGRIV
jgi:hypothetical protein